MTDINHTIGTDYVVQSVRNSLSDDQMIALAGAMLDSISQTNATFTAAVNNQMIELRQLVESAATEANILNQAELDQVNSIVVNLLNSLDIQSLIASMGVRLGTKTYTMASVIAALAQAPRELRTDMIHAADGRSYSGARMTLTDGRQVMFDAVKTELATGVADETRFRYVFNTADFAGVPAMFDMSFIRRKISELQFGGIVIPVFKVLDESRANIQLYLTGGLVELTSSPP